MCQGDLFSSLNYASESHLICEVVHVVCNLLIKSFRLLIYGMLLMLLVLKQYLLVCRFDSEYIF